MTPFEAAPTGLPSGWTVPTRRYAKIKEAAAYLNVTERTVRQMIADGQTGCAVCQGRPSFEAAAYRVRDRRDAIATAQAFHTTNPERGIPDDDEFNAAVAQAISIGRAPVIDITTRKIIA